MLTIKTNRQYRDVLYGYELPKKALAEFDYLSEDELMDRSFVQYKGIWYDIGDFMATNDLNTNAGHHDLSGWHGYASDSFFSGVCIRYDDDCERVMMGTYYS